MSIPADRVMGPPTLTTEQLRAGATGVVGVDDAGNMVRKDGTPAGGSALSPADMAKVQSLPAAPRNVIIDTDWWTDVDDALAMRMALEFERLGVWNILAVAIDTNLVTGPRSLDILQIFDGRPNLPIFIPKTSHVPNGTPSYQAGLLTTTLPAGNVSTVNSASLTALNVPDAVQGMTQVLQGAPGPVEIISIGYLNNLRELLLAQPALVASKVSKMWVMAGEWPVGSENNFTRTAQSRAAGAYVMANWPSPVVLLGYSIGLNIVTGAPLMAQLPTDPVAKALADFIAVQAGGNPVYGRPSWDPMLVLLAASGTVEKGGYTSVKGTASVDGSTGANTFTPSPTGLHEYVVRNVGDGYYTSVINDLVIPNPARKNFKNGDGSLFSPPFSWSRTDRGLVLPAIPAKEVVTDYVNLYQAWSAQDNSDLADAALVDTVANRVRGPLASGSLYLSSTGALRPAMATKGGLRCWQFSGAQTLSTPNFFTPDDATVYAKVWIDSAGTATQTFVATSGPSATYTLRNFHLKKTATTAAFAASFFNNSTTTTDSANASVMPTGAWHVMAFRRSATELEAFFNGVSNGPTAKTTTSDAVVCPLVVGAVRVDASSEPLTGFVREVRLYTSAHTAAQVAAITAEMN